MVVILWLNEHRIGVVMFLAASMWFGAYGFYFRKPLWNWALRGRPHSWSVDMVTKKTVARGVEEVR